MNFIGTVGTAIGLVIWRGTRREGEPCCRRCGGECVVVVWDSDGREGEGVWGRVLLVVGGTGVVADLLGIFVWGGLLVVGVTGVGEDLVARGGMLVVGVTVVADDSEGLVAWGVLLLLGGTGVGEG